MELQAEEFLKTEGHTVEASLRVLFSEQEGTVVAYCPSLDRSTYGDTVDDASAAFDDALLMCSAKAWIQEVAFSLEV